LPHAAPKATEAAAPKATEAATAAPCRIARTQTHGHEATREADHKRKPKRLGCYPITGIAGCCACAASGHAAAAPSSVMNSRRFIRSFQAS
jgi:hypothetical protein